MTLVAVFVALFCLLATTGCTRDRGKDRPACDRALPEADASDKPHAMADAEAGSVVSREKIRTYMTRMMQQYDLAERGIRMELRDTEDGLKIFMLGEVENSESLRVWQSFFGSPYANPDLPVPLVWKVDTRRK
ncbi:MAG: hypothetical protein K8S55_10615 [Phycisphaerae bacterium]|nr:hypothetical protein [Phycisphaerae bacterium]